MLVFMIRFHCMKLVKKSFHCLFLSKHRITTANRHRDNRRLSTSFSCGATQLLPQPFPSTSSGFATLIMQAATTGSVAHGFQRPPVTKKQWLESILPSIAQNKHRGVDKLQPRNHADRHPAARRDTQQTNQFWLLRVKSITVAGKDFALHWSEKTRWRSYCEDTTTATLPATSSIGSVLDRTMLWRSEKHTPAAKPLENEPVRKDAVGYFNRPCCPGAPTYVPSRHWLVGGVRLPLTTFLASASAFTWKPLRDTSNNNYLVCSAAVVVMYWSCSCGVV